MSNNMEVVTFRILLLVTLWIVSLACSAQNNEPLFVVGSTTVSKLVEASAPAFLEKHEVQLLSRPTGSKKGVVAIGEGVSDIGLISRYMTEEEINRWPLVQQITVGQDAIVLATHGDNQVNNITSEQVIDIYTGKLKNWRDIQAGSTGKIRAYSKGVGHGTHDSFLMYFALSSNNLPQSNSVVFRRKGVNSLFGTSQVPTFNQVNQALGLVSRTPGAIAYESLGALNVFGEKMNSNKVKLLTLDGVPPLIDEEFNHEYSLVRPLNLLLTPDSTDAARDYVRFLLTPQGQDLLAQFNYIRMSLDYLESVTVK